MSAILNESSLQLPDTKVIQEATWEAFQGKLKDNEVEHFLDATVLSDEPLTITAMGSLYFLAVYGVISCEPSKYPYKFEESSWGLGATALSAGGVIYTAYDSWDAFFKNTTGYHAQGIAKAGGFLQITFLKKLTPIGQFNAVAGGIGVFEVGGNGKWHKK